jgi:hypothetical protein
MLESAEKMPRRCAWAMAMDSWTLWLSWPPCVLLPLLLSVLALPVPCWQLPVLGSAAVSLFAASTLTPPMLLPLLLLLLRLPIVVGKVCVCVGVGALAGLRHTTRLQDQERRCCSLDSEPQAEVQFCKLFLTQLPSCQALQKTCAWLLGRLVFLGVTPRCSCLQVPLLLLWLPSYSLTVTAPPSCQSL